MKKLLSLALLVFVCIVPSIASAQTACVIEWTHDPSYDYDDRPYIITSETSMTQEAALIVFNNWNYEETHRTDTPTWQPSPYDGSVDCYSGQWQWRL